MDPQLIAIIAASIVLAGVVLTSNRANARAVREEMNARFDKVDERFRAVDAQFRAADAQFRAVRNDISALAQRMAWVEGAVDRRLRPEGETAAR